MLVVVDGAVEFHRGALHHLLARGRALHRVCTTPNNTKLHQIYTTPKNTTLHQIYTPPKNTKLHQIYSTPINIKHCLDPKNKLPLLLMIQATEAILIEFNLLSHLGTLLCKLLHEVATMMIQLTNLFKIQKMVNDTKHN